MDEMFTMNLNGILATLISKILKMVKAYVEGIIQKEIGIMPLD